LKIVGRLENLSNGYSLKTGQSALFTVDVSRSVSGATPINLALLDEAEPT
jgi:hypothetical protein